jgi:hypothetical protein
VNVPSTAGKSLTESLLDMALWNTSVSKSPTGNRLIKLLFLVSCDLVATVTGEPKVFSLPLHRSERRSVVKRDHAGVLLENDYPYGLYWVNATVGTPGQLVQLQIDTGSSDVWVFGPHSCVQSTSPCLGGYCKYTFTCPLPTTP